MKKSIAWVIGAAALFAGGVALAQDAKAPPPAAKAAANASMPTKAQIDEHIKKMQALHEKVTGAATPEERQKALEEARKEMQDAMKTMQPMMQGGGMMGDGTMGRKGKAADNSAQMQMMGERVDMMQMMMQMMMDQQGMMGGTSKMPESAPKK